MVTDMRKLIAVVLTVILTLSLSGCGRQKPAGPVDITGSSKQLLPLQYMPVFEEELEPDPPQFEEISLPCQDIPEIQSTRFSDDPELSVFSGFIKDRFGIVLDGSWKVFVHYYDEQQTYGMAEFMYTVGEIDTNRCVIFQLDEGNAERVYFKNLDSSVDEDDLTDRVDLFRSRYEQERPVLGKDEHLEEEKVSYVYYYNTDRLVYCYNVFFSYGELRVINNDWGTQCFIGEDGEAQFFGIVSAKDI